MIHPKLQYKLGTAILWIGVKFFSLAKTFIDLGERMRWQSRLDRIDNVR